MRLGHCPLVLVLASLAFLATGAPATAQAPPGSDIYLYRLTVTHDTVTLTGEDKTQGFRRGVRAVQHRRAKEGAGEVSGFVGVALVVLV